MSERKQMQITQEGLEILREYVGRDEFDPVDPQDDEGILDIIREHAELHSGMGMLWSADEAYADPSAHEGLGYTIEYGRTGASKYLLVRRQRADGNSIDEETYDLVVADDPTDL